MPPGVTIDPMPKGTKTNAFWDKLVTLSAQRGLSLNRLARVADVSRQGMEKWKTGSQPTLETLYKLARALDVPVAELTGAPDKRATGSYASLERYLVAHPELDDDTVDFLFRQSFTFGDPGEVTWQLLVATFQTARAQARK